MRQWNGSRSRSRSWLTSGIKHQQAIDCANPWEKTLTSHGHTYSEYTIHVFIHSSPVRLIYEGLIRLIAEFFLMAKSAVRMTFRL